MPGPVSEQYQGPEPFDWPPSSARVPEFGHHRGCAPPQREEDAPDDLTWGCVPGCPALVGRDGGS